MFFLLFFQGKTLDGLLFVDLFDSTCYIRGKYIGLAKPNVPSDRGVNRCTLICTYVRTNFRVPQGVKGNKKI